MKSRNNTLIEVRREVSMRNMNSMSFTASDKVLFSDFLDLCNHELLHISEQKIDGDLLPSNMLENGQNSDIHLPPRPGCVYLSCPGSRGRAYGRYLYIIDVDLLDPSCFRVDEDNFILALADNLSNRLGKSQYQPIEGIPEGVLRRVKDINANIDSSAGYDSKWFNDVTEELDTAEQVLRSLADGSCAYEGVIPKRAIKTVVDWDRYPRVYGSYWALPEFITKSTKLSKHYGWTR